MKNKEIHTTSSLRRERNIYNPRTFLQNRNGTGFGRLVVLFMESLVKRGAEPGTVLRFCIDLRPFLENIGDAHGITVLADLERSHVEGYAAAVCSAYEAGEKTFINALDANSLLSAVRMFCLYLYTAGALAEDYGYAAPTIPYPTQQSSVTGNE